MASDRYTITLPSGEAYDPDRPALADMQRVPGSVMPMTGAEARGAASEYANQALFGMGHRIGAAGAYQRGEFPSYEEALADQTKRSEQFRKENPWTATGADIMGTATTGVGLGLGGATLIGRAPAAIARAAPWAARTLEGGLEGALYSGAQGAGQTYTGKLGDILGNAAGAAPAGFIGGVVAPSAGSMAGAASRGIANKFGAIPGSVAREAQANEAGLRTVPTTTRAMIPDYMPRTASAVYNAIGPGGTQYNAALKARDVSSPQFITNFVDRRFGTSRPESFSQEEIRSRMQDVGTRIEAVLNGPNVRAIDNTALAHELDAAAINLRDPAQKQLAEVRKMLNITGTDVLDPHPSVLQQVRTRVRGMEETAAHEGKYDAARRLGNVYDQLTNEMNAKIPGIRPLNAEYAELGQQTRALDPGSVGRRAFKKGDEALWPEEFEQAMTQAAQPKGTAGPSAEPFRIREAARAQLQRIVGTNKNDLLALENLLAMPHDWNSQKLAIAFGQDRANDLQQVLRNERRFRETFQKGSLEGSQTDPRASARKEFEGGDEKIISPSAGLFGASMTLLKRGYDAMREASTNAARDRIAGMMATTSSAEQQRVIEQMLAAAPTRERRAQIINLLTRQGVIAGGTAVEANQ